MRSDPISDMLSRIRNAIQARHDRTLVPASRLKKRMAEILKDEGYIADVSESENSGHRNLTIVLKYDQNRKSAIDGLRRVSRPGRRVYVGYQKIPHTVAGLGISILSTSKGLMSDGDARRHKVGGEVLCEVW
ncbi:MAG: 30S ribosomal protein S8 [Deltaproteobacteria bacterium]|jgi:small subunit ribosomal protein S8|nr:30S ribosomal protein S8 [Deltaproteobacteria bacterium]MBW2529929.1 30S ribosomal protein S8 [Deltaproteobacteria bacterium]